MEKGRVPEIPDEIEMRGREGKIDSLASFSEHRRKREHEIKTKNRTHRDQRSAKKKGVGVLRTEKGEGGAFARAPGNVRQPLGKGVKTNGRATGDTKKGPQRIIEDRLRGRGNYNPGPRRPRIKNEKTTNKWRS